METLKDFAQKKWRTRWSPEHTGRDPAYFQIDCQRGHIYQHGPDTLAVTLTRRPRIRNKLIRAGCTPVQDGDDECTLLFPATQLDQVAKIVGARKRPQLTPERREALRERMNKLNQSLASHRPREKGTLSGLESTQRHQGDSGHQLTPQEPLEQL